MFFSFQKTEGALVDVKVTTMNLRTNHQVIKNNAWPTNFFQNKCPFTSSGGGGGGGGGGIVNVTSAFFLG